MISWSSIDSICVGQQEVERKFESCQATVELQPNVQQQAVFSTTGTTLELSTISTTTAHSNSFQYIIIYTRLIQYVILIL